MTTEITATAAVLFGIFGMFINGALIVRGYWIAWLGFLLALLGSTIGIMVLAGG